VAGEDAGPASPPHTRSEECAHKLRLRVANDFVEYHFDLLQTLFLELWRKTKDGSWEDASSSVDELRKELFRDSFAQNLAPVRDWNLSMLCTALAPSRNSSSNMRTLLALEKTC
jgi:hypothetical protein